MKISILISALLVSVSVFAAESEAAGGVEQLFLGKSRITQTPPELRPSPATLAPLEPPPAIISCAEGDQLCSAIDSMSGKTSALEQAATVADVFASGFRSTGPRRDELLDQAISSLKFRVAISTPYGKQVLAYVVAEGCRRAGPEADCSL